MLVFDDDGGDADVDDVGNFCDGSGDTNDYTRFVRVLENLESHGILFFSFPGLECHGILCRVMESHGKLNHYKKLWVDLYCDDRQKFHWMYFTELWIISLGKDRKSHGKSHGKSWNFL